MLTYNTDTHCHTRTIQACVCVCVFLFHPAAQQEIHHLLFSEAGHCGCIEGKVTAAHRCSLCFGALEKVVDGHAES